MRNKKSISLIISLISVFIIGLSFLVGFLFKDKDRVLEDLDGEQSINVSVVSDDATIEDKGGAIYVEPGSSYTMYGGIVSGKATTYGGAIFVSNGATFTMKGGTIENCSSSYGGAIFVANGGKCIIDGGKIEDCSASANGGGIYVEGNGTLELVKGEIKNCTATSYGGAIYTNSNLSIDNNVSLLNTNTDNVSNRGGAIYFNGKTLDINGSKIEGFKTTGYAGAIWNQSGTVNISNATLISNKTDGRGGVLFNKNGVVNISNSYIQGCEAKDGGSVINDTKGTLNIDDVTFEGCNASSAGGAIYNSGTCTIKGDSTFYNNKASGWGGSIINHGTMTMSAGHIYSDQVYSDDGVANRGGGIYNSGTFEFSGTAEIFDCYARQDGSGVYNTGTFTITDTASIRFNRIASDSTSGNGGNVYTSGTMIMNGGSINGGSASYGGNIYSEGELTINSGTVLSGSAYNDGGSIYSVSSSFKTTIKDITVSYSSCGGKGGAFYLSGSAELTNITFENCYSYGDGGAIFVAGTTDFSCTDTEIKNCEAIRNGGAIYLDSAENFSCNQVDIYNCNAKGSGGALYLASADSCQLIVNIDLCVAGVNGGGIYYGSLDTSMYEDTNDVMITNCTATNGGGFYSTLSEPENYYNAYITNCTATNDGGGCYIKNEAETTNEYIIAKNCTAGNNGGGGYVENSDDVSFGVFSFTECEASNNGGGIYLSNTTSSKGATLHSSIDDCSALMGGGAYLINASEEANISFSPRIENCTATTGGGLYLESLSTVYMGGYISGCIASENGGGIFVKDTKTLEYGKVFSCQAEYGGGIYAENTEVTDYDYDRLFQPIGFAQNVKNLVSANEEAIYDNKANCDGGGFYLKNSYLSQSKTIIANNMSDGEEAKGGNVYIDRTSGFGLLGGGITISEEADTGAVYGGVIYCEGRITINETLFVSGPKVEISGGKATYGGAIYLSGGTLSIDEKSTLTIKNTSSDYGGAIYIDEDSVVSASGEISIESSSANEGGAIYCAGTFDFAKGYIKSCSSTTKGGSIYLTGGTLSNTSGYSLDINNSVSEYGGAIYIDKESTCSLYNGEIYSCEASYGGAIYCAGELNVKKGSIYENAAAESGGGVYLTGSFTINNCEILSNQAINGGAIYSNKGTVEREGTDNININNNIAQRGAGIYFSAGKSLSLDFTNVKLQNNKATYNSLRGFGGAIYNAGNLELLGVTINGDSEQANASVGGGIYNSGTLTLKNATLKDLYVSEYGAAIDTEGNLTLDGVSILNCEAADRGGAVFALKTSTTTIIGNSKISNNIATKGGAFSLTNSATLIMDSGTINNNRLSINNNKAWGGQIYLQTATTKFIMNDGTISGNAEPQTSYISDYVNAYYGGGIYSVGTVEINGGTIVNCVATCGGAVYNLGQIDLIGTSVQIKENFSKSGGAIYSVDATCNLLGGEIVNNYASNHGAGVYATGSTFVIDGTNIDNNILVADNLDSFNRGHGGGIVVSSCNVTMNSGSISNNTINETAVQPFAGGVYVTGTTEFIFNGGTIQNNVIKSNKGGGGNIFINPAAKFIMNGGLLAGDRNTCQAQLGGAIQNYGKVEIYGGEISGCRAIYGGAISNFGELTIKDSTPQLDGGERTYLTIKNCFATSGIGSNIFAANTINIEDSVNISTGSIVIACVKYTYVESETLFIDEYVGKIIYNKNYDEALTQIARQTIQLYDFDFDDISLVTSSFNNGYEGYIDTLRNGIANHYVHKFDGSISIEYFDEEGNTYGATYGGEAKNDWFLDTNGFYSIDNFKIETITEEKGFKLIDDRNDGNSFSPVGLDYYNPNENINQYGVKIWWNVYIDYFDRFTMFDSPYNSLLQGEKMKVYDKDIVMVDETTQAIYPFYVDNAGNIQNNYDYNHKFHLYAHFSYWYDVETSVDGNLNRFGVNEEVLITGDKNIRSYYFISVTIGSRYNGFGQEGFDVYPFPTPNYCYEFGLEFYSNYFNYYDGDCWNRGYLQEANFLGRYLDDGEKEYQCIVDWDIYDGVIFDSSYNVTSVINGYQFNFYENITIDYADTYHYYYFNFYGNEKVVDPGGFVIEEVVYNEYTINVNGVEHSSYSYDEYTEDFLGFWIFEGDLYLGDGTRYTGSYVEVGVTYYFYDNVHIYPDAIAKDSHETTVTIYTEGESGYRNQIYSTTISYTMPDVLYVEVKNGAIYLWGQKVVDIPSTPPSDSGLLSNVAIYDSAYNRLNYVVGSSVLYDEGISNGEDFIIIIHYIV